MAAVALSFAEQINPAIDIIHARQDVSIAVTVKTDTEEVAPPSTVHVDLQIHDAPLLEAEIEVGGSLSGSGTSHTGTPVGIPNRNTLIRRDVRAGDIIHIEILRGACGLVMRHPTVLTVEVLASRGQTVEIIAVFHLSYRPDRHHQAYY